MKKENEKKNVSLGVYKAIINIMAELSKSGISKVRKNQQQGYSFRGIDDMYNAFAPLLSKNNLCILPNVIERQTTERITKNGGVIFYTTVKTAFTLVCTDDGSTAVVTTEGEAMDSADKSTNKAQSAAYKYMCMQTFCIPTEGDNDADGTTPDPLKPKEQPKAKQQTKTPPAAALQQEPKAPPPAAVLPQDVLERLYEAKSKAELLNICREIGTKRTELKLLLNAFYNTHKDKTFSPEGN